MHPLTINRCPARLFSPRDWWAAKIALIDSSFAESMKAHVFATRTSASSADDVISNPWANTLPSVISASTSFLAQPRLIMRTFVLIEGEIEPCDLLVSDLGLSIRHRFAVLPNFN